MGTSDVHPWRAVGFAARLLPDPRQDEGCPIRASHGHHGWGERRTESQERSTAASPIVVRSASRALPPLVGLLLKGTPPAKEQACFAIWNLACQHPDNQVAIEPAAARLFLAAVHEQAAGLAQEREVDGALSPVLSYLLFYALIHELWHTEDLVHTRHVHRLPPPPSGRPPPPLPALPALPALPT